MQYYPPSIRPTDATETLVDRMTRRSQVPLNLILVKASAVTVVDGEDMAHLMSAPSQARFKLIRCRPFTVTALIHRRLVYSLGDDQQLYVDDPEGDVRLLVPLDAEGAVHRVYDGWHVEVAPDDTATSRLNAKVYPVRVDSGMLTVLPAPGAPVDEVDVVDDLPDFPSRVIADAISEYDDHEEGNPRAGSPTAITLSLTWYHTASRVADLPRMTFHVLVIGGREADAVTEALKVLEPWVAGAKATSVFLESFPDLQHRSSATGPA